MSRNNMNEEQLKASLWINVTEEMGVDRLREFEKYAA